MGRSKNKTTQEKLSILLNKKNALEASLQTINKEITLLDKQLKQEQLDQLVNTINHSGLSITEVINLVTENKK